LYQCPTPLDPCPMKNTCKPWEEPSVDMVIWVELKISLALHTSYQTSRESALISSIQSPNTCNKTCQQSWVVKI
jgi:hypothetical protein